MPSIFQQRISSRPCEWSRNPIFLFVFFSRTCLQILKMCAITLVRGGIHLILRPFTIYVSLPLKHVTRPDISSLNLTSSVPAPLVGFCGPEIFSSKEASSSRTSLISILGSSPFFRLCWLRFNLLSIVLLLRICSSPLRRISGLNRCGILGARSVDV